MLKDSPDHIRFFCTECGKESGSLGTLHAHIEAKHTGFGPYNIIPNLLKIGDFDHDMTMTKALNTNTGEEIELSEVSGFA